MKNIEKLILSTNPNCLLCGKNATSLHSFLMSRKIYQVKNCVPVCNSCKEDLEIAVKYEYISQNPKDLEEIKNKTVNLLNDKNFEEFKKNLTSKRFLTKEEICSIEGLTKAQLKKINSVLKRDLWYNKLENLKFSGKEIFKIQKIMKTFKYRAVV